MGRFQTMIQKFIAFHTDEEGYINREQDNQPIQTPRTDLPVAAALDDSLAKIKEIFYYPASADLMLREFTLSIGGQPTRAFVLFFDGMASSTLISQFILEPLVHMSGQPKPDNMPLTDFVEQHLLTINQLSRAATYQEAIDSATFGECALFVDGMPCALIADTKNWQKRGIDKPSTDRSILGPQEAFNELMRGNTAMLRKTIKDPNLIIESMTAGRKSKTGVAVCYIKNLASDSLVNEVKRRIQAVDADYILASEDLQNFLEDSQLRLMPQILTTERPDRTAMEICDGNVALLVNGSPFALIMPATFFSFMKTTDDNYLRMPYANFVSILRYLAVIISVLLPGLFIVITQYHHELIPTDLLYALEASFEKTPFPLVIELITLEIAFELIREAEIKFPSIGGSSVGIVGGLILGQAAVTANIVSPIVIIVVAFTAIGSMTTPSYQMGIAFRIMRFTYIIFGALAGMLGVTLVLFTHLLLLSTYKCFGVRYFAPVAPRNREGALKTVFVTRQSKYPSKPDYVNSKQEASEHNPNADNEQPS